MKKLLLVFIIGLFVIASCRKVDGCGIVKGGDYEINQNGTTSYFFWVLFEGSSRERKVYVDYKTFIDFRIGTKVCF